MAPQSPEASHSSSSSSSIPDFALPASGGGCNPQDMTPSSKKSTISSKDDALNSTKKVSLEAEYGEVSLLDDFDDDDDDDEFDASHDVELGDDNSDSDDDNSLVAGGESSQSSGGPINAATACGHCSKDDVTSSRTVIFWLLFWLCNNIGLTLLNKATFAKYDFKYPFFLSFFHMACNYLGGEVTLWLAARRRRRNTGEEQSQEKGEYAPVSLGNAEGGGRSGRRLKRSKSLVLDGLHRAELDAKGSLKMWAFSIIFSLNIAIGNVSLRYVSVNFNQVMRSLVPAVAIVFGLCLGKKTSTKRVLSVVPIIGGVAMACYGEMALTKMGFVFTSLCVVLAALKAVAAGEILTGELKLHPVDLLNKMAPKAAVQCLILSLLTGELHSIASRWHSELSPITGDIHPTLGVLSTGLMSFSLNISSLMSNKLTSPLTLCIAANVKQVLMIGMATVIFSTPISAVNGGGIGVVLIGSAIYSLVSLREKQQAATEAEAQAASSSSSGAKKDNKKGARGKNLASSSKTVRIATTSQQDSLEFQEDEEEGGSNGNSNEGLALVSTGAR